MPGIEENGAAGDSLAIAVSNDDVGDQRLDAAGFVTAELAMRDIKPGSLPQGMSKEPMEDRKHHSSVEAQSLH